MYNMESHKTLNPFIKVVVAWTGGKKWYLNFLQINTIYKFFRLSEVLTTCSIVNSNSNFKAIEQQSEKKTGDSFEFAIGVKLSHDLRNKY